MAAGLESQQAPPQRFHKCHEGRLVVYEPPNLGRPI